MKIIESTPTRLVAQEPNSMLLYAVIIFGIAGIFVLFKSVIFGAVLLAIGALIYVLKQVLTLSLDKVTGKATLNTQSIVKNKITETEIEQIASVRLFTQNRQERSTDDQGNTTVSNERETSLLLLLKNGQTVDLSDTYQSTRPLFFAGNSGVQPNQTIGLAIATFLGVPFENAVPGQFSQSFTAQAVPGQVIMPVPVTDISVSSAPAVYTAANTENQPLSEPPML